jgi:MFS family permease
MLVAFALSSLAIGKLSDVLGRRKLLMLGAALAYALCWLPLAAGTALPAAASYGLFALMGASATGFTLSWANVKEMNPPALSGTAMAVVNTGVFLGPTLYQPLIGWIMDRGGFRPAMAVLGAFAFMGLVAAFLVREAR